MPKKSNPPPDSETDPVMQALNAKVVMLFVDRCAVYGIPPDPDSKDFWRLMTYSFVFEYLMAEHRPPAKGKKTKPERWTGDEKRRLLELFWKEMAGGKKAGGKTVGGAARTLARSERVSGNPKSIETRF